MAAREKAVGVIGGMGPEATIELMRRVLRATPAEDDADHIRLLVDNNPKIPSRIAALIEGTGEDPTPVLVSMARGLATAGADVLAIPCNTAHHYLPAIREAVAVPVLDMIALSVARLSAMTPRPRRVALLASPAVRLTGLFEARLGQAGFDILYPDGAHEAAVLAIIRAVKGAGPGPDHIAAYERAVADLAARGADAYALACTELSLIDRPASDRPMLDTLDVLAEEIVARAKGDANRGRPDQSPSGEKAPRASGEGDGGGREPRPLRADRA